MASDIKVGDYVEVIAWPCCGAFLGHKFIVSELRAPYRQYFRCNTHCYERHESATFTYAMDLTVPGGQKFLVKCPVQWLRKLPPLTDDTEVIREKEISNV